MLLEYALGLTEHILTSNPQDLRHVTERSQVAAGCQVITGGTHSTNKAMAVLVCELDKQSVVPLC